MVRPLIGVAIGLGVVSVGLVIVGLASLPLFDARYRDEQISRYQSAASAIERLFGGDEISLRYARLNILMVSIIGLLFGLGLSLLGGWLTVVATIQVFE